MTESQLQSLEKEVKASLKTSSALTGVYYSLSSMPSDVMQAFKRESIAFWNAQDKYKKSAGMLQHWPSGRGIFVSHLKDVFIWINADEHFTIGVVQKDGNLKTAFQRLCLNAEHVLNNFKWWHDDQLGHLMTSPALVGSGLKIYASIKLAYLSQDEAFRQDLLDQYGLECMRAETEIAISKKYVLSNKQTFGLTESEILAKVYQGLKDICAIEGKFNESNEAAADAKIVVNDVNKG